MEKKYNTMEYNNAIKCEICGALTFADDYGNTCKCQKCGWKSNGGSEFYEECYGISYPMLVPLSRAKEQYKAGQKFKAMFEDFINGLKFYAEMLFWHNGKVYEVFRKNNGAVLASKEFEQSFISIDEFHDQANIGGRLLKDIWDEVVHPCFMYCGDEHDYDFPPED
ncbi:MAG: hypothetical protein K2J01_06575 [Clostridiales bacterium]|nr:hypothetical protein [Clostridiales bacterium]